DAVDPAGALPSGGRAGHGRHRQECADLLPGEPPGSSVRGGALALPQGRSPVRGAGRSLHHLLLRDASRRVPHFAGAAHHAARGAGASGARRRETHAATEESEDRRAPGAVTGTRWAGEGGGNGKRRPRGGAGTEGGRAGGRTPRTVRAGGGSVQDPPGEVAPA